MGMYNNFEADPLRETEGVFLDYGDFRVRIAHAGQSNKRYVAYAEKKFRPVRQAMNAGVLSNERSLAIIADIYANVIILDWEVASKKEDGSIVWKQGIEDRDGSILPFNVENVINTLKALPNLIIDLQAQAQSIANFRRAEVEIDSGNL